MNIIPSHDDDPEFITAVNAILSGVLVSTSPEKLILIKINGWFGPKWLTFSGKVIGAIGVWEDNLTVPPFVPNRVVEQRAFFAPEYAEAPPGKPIHRELESVLALQRRVSNVSGRAALAWYSGNSLINGRGSFMTYLPAGDDYWPWYASWTKKQSWRITQTKEITLQQLAAFQELGLTISTRRLSVICVDLALPPD